MVKFVGNVPAKPPAGGTLRHKGWRAAKVDLPAIAAQAGRHRHRAGGNRNRVKARWQPAIRHRDRPRHHQLRARLRRNSGGAPTRSRRRTCSCSPIPQLVNPGEVREEALLPSFLYLPGAADFPAGTLALPWDAERGYVVGQLAQKRGAENAGRLVSSAKSWLSHSGVDRTSAAAAVPRARRRGENLAGGGQPPLPGAPARGVGRKHAGGAVRRAAGAGHRAGLVRRGGARADAGSARKQAGYENITLLEEPQAAFYAWIERHADWRERVQLGDLILVVDIGGGTTDFTLIAVTEANGELALEPRGGGRAHPAGRRQYRPGAGRRGGARGWPKRARASTAASMQALWNNCRVAKEKLLDPESNAQGTAGHDSRQGHGPGGRHHQGVTAARAISTRCWARAFCRRWRAPTCRRASAASGCRNSGLPYAADPAITRHLARFLRQQASASRARRGAARPERAGLPHARAVQRRRAECGAGARAHSGDAQLRGWRRKACRRSKPLSGEDLMHAVARGAAYYGLARQRPRRAHPRRRAAHLLRRRGERDAVDSRLPGAAEGAHRGRRSAWRKAPSRASPAASSAWWWASRRSSASSPRPRARTTRRAT